MAERLGEHDVARDFAGMAGYERLTCRTCGDATLVRQPYMTDAVWTEKVSAFLSWHEGIPKDLVI